MVIALPVVVKNTGERQYGLRRMSSQSKKQIVLKLSISWGGRGNVCVKLLSYLVNRF